MSTPGGDAESRAAPPGVDATRTGQYAQADLSPGTVLAGRFRVESMLGMGGMGVVYRATDLDLGIPVAIKVLRPELASRPDAFERFRNELLLARQVSSPHVLRIHDIARDGERWLISMDFVDGKPLDRVLDERGSLPVDEALAIARQVALGLSAAHAQGVVHRDLKPSNVLLDGEGRAWVGDFGIARSLGGSGGLTHTGQVIGTPDYLSPEQARAEPVDARSDLYTLGLVLYEMLSGRLPFSGGTPAEAISQRMVASPAPIRQLRADVPPWVERLLMRLLQTRPSRRFQDADAVVRAIDAKHVAADLHPRAGTWIAMALAGVVVAALLAWRFWPAPAAIPTAAVVPVPTRLAVLPMENATGDAALASTLAGATEWLRWELADRVAVPVVDGERVDQAVAQLTMPDSDAGAIDSRKLHAVLPASRQLRIRVEGNRGQYTAQLRLREPSGEEGRTRVQAADLAELAAAIVPAAATLVDPQAKPLPAHAPGDAQLAGLGEALVPLRRGRPAEALALLAKSPDAGFGAASLARVQAAFWSGRRDEALEAGRAKISGKALAARMRYWQALAGNGADAELAAEAATVKRSPDDLDAALRLATLQAQAGDGPAASRTLEALLARDANDPRAWYQLGRLSIMRGELRAAVEDQLVRALVLYKRARHAFGEAETINALGVGYSRLGQTEEAQAHFRDAIARRRALGDRRGVASSLRNLAQLSTVQGQFADAQAQLEEARSLFAELGDDDGLNAVDNELGLLAEERGDFVTADAAYRRMLRGSEQAGDDIGRAESLNNIGYAQYQLGDYDAAQVFWQQAAGIFAAQQDMNGQVRAGQNLGLLETARGNWSRARKLLDTSLAQAGRQQMVEEAAVTRRNLAELDLLQGDVAAADRHLAAAAALFAEREDQRGEIDVALLRVRRESLLGRLDAAQAGLEALVPRLAQASTEQAAIAALLRARIAMARGDAGAAAAALAQARARAAASGVSRWQLEAALFAGGAPDAALRESIQRLGNVALLLDMHAHALRQPGLAADTAVAEYRRAAELLDRVGKYAEAATLHALGAAALARAGDEAGAAAARKRAEDSTVRAGNADAKAAREDADGQ
jgi:tetratricopeptide (TPR) repeat protein